MTPLRYGVHVPVFTDPGSLVDLGVLAERHGWDGCFLWDHVLGSRESPMPIADPWVVLGALAVRTERIRLGTAVTPLPRRRPEKVAREAVTVDQLSGGRMVLGVGLGSPPAVEYGAFGEPADERVLAGVLDEALEVLVGLWSGERFSHAGPRFHVDQVTFLPRPLQRPRIPVWVACTWPHRRPLRRAARWDGMVAAWPAPDGGLERLAPDQVAELVAEVRRHRTADGPFDVAVVNPVLPDERDAAAYAAAGATWYLLAGWLDDLGRQIQAGPPG